MSYLRLPGAVGTRIGCVGKTRADVCLRRVAGRLRRQPPVATAHQHARRHRHRAAGRTAGPEAHDHTPPRRAARACQEGMGAIRRHGSHHSAPGPSDLPQSWPRDKRAKEGAWNTSRASRPCCYARVMLVTLLRGCHRTASGEEQWREPQLVLSLPRGRRAPPEGPRRPSHAGVVALSARRHSCIPGLPGWYVDAGRPARETPN